MWNRAVDHLAGAALTSSSSAFWLAQRAPGEDWSHVVVLSDAGVEAAGGRSGRGWAVIARLPADRFKLLAAGSRYSPACGGRRRDVNAEEAEAMMIPWRLVLAARAGRLEEVRASGDLGSPLSLSAKRWIRKLIKEDLGLEV